MKKNFWLKISSVLLGMILWLFVLAKGQTEVSIEARINFKNVPEGLQMVEEESTTRTVLGIKGHERFIRDVSPEDVAVLVDLAGLTEGEHSYVIKSGDVRLRSPLAVSSINPSAIRVTLEKPAAKTVPVSAVLTGAPAAGFGVVRVEVTPAEVTLRGRRSELRGVRELRTEPVDVSSATENIVVEAGIEKAGRNVTAGIQAVTVRVVIEKERR